jgi:hypothetical protein
MSDWSTLNPNPNPNPKPYLLAEAWIQVHLRKQQQSPTVVAETLSIDLLIYQRGHGI